MIHHVHPEGSRPIRRALDIAKQGDILDLHPGLYREEISTYDGPIAPDLTIRAYRRGDVTLAPVGTDRVVTLAEASASGMLLSRLQLDASNCHIDAVKIANYAPERKVDRVSITDCEIWGAPGQGVLAAGSYHRFTRLKIHHCGRTTWLDHGIYLTGDHCLISEVDAYQNAGLGFKIQSEDPLDDVSHNLLRYSRAIDNAQNTDGYGAGILVGGTENRVYRCASRGARIGVQVGGAAIDCEVIDCEVGGNTPHPRNLQIPATVWVMPGAVGTRIEGTGIDANVEV